jgi:hypothetical protein
MMCESNLARCSSELVGVANLRDAKPRWSPSEGEIRDLDVGASAERGVAQSTPGFESESD